MTRSCEQYRACKRLLQTELATHFTAIGMWHRFDGWCLIREVGCASMLHVVSKSRISWKPLPLRFAKEKCEVVQKAAEQEKDVYIGDMALSDVPSLSEIAPEQISV